MIAEALSYAFFQRALAAGLLASVACGMVGSLVVVRGIASASGGLSHAAFGGVGLGFLLGFDPMLGALGFGLGSALGIGAAELRLRQGLDTLIAMVWAVGMALGILFVSLAPGPAPDLLGYLFGNILFVSAEYLLLAAALDAVVLAVVLARFRRLRAIAFDEEFSRVVGMPVARLFLTLLALVGLTVVLLIRVVGVILVIALLTIPAATARHWTADLARMMGLSVLLGAAAITAGLFLTWFLSARLAVDIPTGPAVILLAALGYGLSAVLRRALPLRSATG
ncbi:MAG: metal ABC transporter permease [Gemmatimonadota bacterium]|nr:metal ABC transporter permease [Gemmatimonadota bacterium]